MSDVAPLGGRYRFLKKLPTASRGVIWLAYDSLSNASVVAATITASRLQGLRCALGVVHEHLASVLGVFENVAPDQVPDLAACGDSVTVGVVQDVAGCSLQEQLDQHGKLSVVEAGAVMCCVTSALAHLHEHGAVHGAVCAANVVFSRERNHVAVLSNLRAPSNARYSCASRLAGQGPSMHDDLWAAGVLLYYLVFGTLPFSGTSRDQLIAAINVGVAQAHCNSSLVDPALAAIVERALSLNEQARFASVFELSEALYRWHSVATGSGSIFVPPTELRATIPTSAPTPLHGHIVSDDEFDGYEQQTIVQDSGLDHSEMPGSGAALLAPMHAAQRPSGPILYQSAASSAVLSSPTDVQRRSGDYGVTSAVPVAGSGAAASRGSMPSADSGVSYRSSVQQGIARQSFPSYGSGPALSPAVADSSPDGAEDSCDEDATVVFQSSDMLRRAYTLTESSRQTLPQSPASRSHSRGSEVLSIVGAASYVEHPAQQPSVDAVNSSLECRNDHPSHSGPRLAVRAYTLTEGSRQTVPLSQRAPEMSQNVGAAPLALPYAERPPVIHTVDATNAPANHPAGLPGLGAAATGLTLEAASSHRSFPVTSVSQANKTHDTHGAGPSEQLVGVSDGRSDGLPPLALRKSGRLRVPGLIGMGVLLGLVLTVVAFFVAVLATAPEVTDAFKVALGLAKVAPTAAPSPLLSLDAAVPDASLQNISEEANAASSVVDPSSLSIAKDVGQCVASLFPKDSFVEAVPMDFVCSNLGLQKIGSEMLPAIVNASGRRGITTAMRVWPGLGWYELVAVAVLRESCCVGLLPVSSQTSTARVSGPCESFDEVLGQLAKHDCSAGAVQNIVERFDKLVDCYFGNNLKRPYGYRGQIERTHKSRAVELLSEIQKNRCAVPRSSASATIPTP